MPAQTFSGPDLNPKPARFRPPSGACDSHAHLRAAPSAGYDDYARMHEVLGIDRGVLTQSSQFGTDNSLLLSALERDPANLRGIVTLDPDDLTPQAIATLDKKGVRGVRVHAERFEHIEAFATRIGKSGWRLELYPPSVAGIVELRPRLEKLQCPVVVDAMGKPDASLGTDEPGFVELVAMVRDGVVWMKLAQFYHVSRGGPPYADVLPFARALVEAGPAHCVWGTDWPHGATAWATPNDGLVLDLLAEWVPDEAARNRILVDNPAGLNRF